MSESCRICGCIEPLLVALACAEAMEHNAVVGKESRSIGENVKRLISDEEYDELMFNHNWLEYPIIEPMATLGFAIAMREIREKCDIATDEIHKLFRDATKANEKGQFGAAQQKFIDVKSKVAELATELCGEEKGT